jgi:Protein of unknown function DUF262/Protein of unknown function (DUF1524)
VAKFNFEHMGIGAVLRRERLKVPPNQRSYAWEDGHVEDLFTDLSGAREDGSDYFLGTIVLTQQNGGIPEVADGQQRLATVSILLAAIRDKFAAMGRDARATDIDTNYLRQLAEDVDDVVPKLTLNTDDADFFTRYALAFPAERPKVSLLNLRASNIKIRQAFSIASDHVEKIVSQFGDDELKARTLLDWVNYLRTQVTVVIVTVPSDLDAYRMFETLNDRGLRASQADLLKNYFFSRAQKRLGEAQTRWSSLSGAIEALGEDSDLVTYIRHYWICRYGPTKEKDLAADIRKVVTGETKTMELMVELEQRVQDYTALFNPSSQKWAVYTDYCRDYIRVFIEDLRVEQVRPLLFAIASYMAPAEAEKAYRLIIAWSVRFLIVGGRGGFLDRIYSLRAQEVGTGVVITAKQLEAVMRDQVPQDVAFEESFRTARVSRTWLARYYIRCLDLAMSGETEPETIANRNKEVLTLEHILPHRPGPAWSIDEEVATALQNRLGNMTLLRATKNVEAGNRSFDDKKKFFHGSTLPITRQVLEYNGWSSEQVNDRQSKMAKLAIRTWPIGSK